MIPTSNPLLTTGRMELGIDSNAEAGNVIIIMPTNKGIADLYTFNVLNLTSRKKSHEEFSSCK